MARIFGVELPNKRIEISLTYIYGIGLPIARKILESTKINKNKRASELSENEINEISRYVSDNEIIIGGDCKNQVTSSIKRLIQINCYRGIRHRRGLPVRGQRTKTNSKTRKGRGRALANKKKVGK